MSRAAWIVIITSLGGAALAQPPVSEAARLFERGNALYDGGEYRAAIEAFTAAQRVAPHPMTQFSIGRCHESLGELARAFAIYRRARAAAATPGQRRTIDQRLALLGSRPYKVFVSSRPPGASITVDGRARPEPGVTPRVLLLAPGEHVLLLRLRGHRLAARRVVVEVGREQPVEVALTPAAAPCPAAPARTCPEPAPAPFVPGEGLQLHLGLLGSLGIAGNRPFSGGAGIRAHGTVGRLVLGGQLQVLTLGTTALPPEQVTEGEVLDHNGINWLLAQAEAGWMVPLRTSYAWATLGLGLFYERHKFSGWQVQGGVRRGAAQRIEEDTGFVWSLGGGVAAMITRWLSVGGSFRVGMLHGSRTDQDDADAEEDSDNAPFGTVSLAVSFHI
jgi:hypothetical protein